MSTSGNTFFSIPEPPHATLLADGMHLSRDEFERRFTLAGPIGPVELIEGVVRLPSPTRFESHGAPSLDLIWWLTHYTIYMPGVRAGCAPTVH